MLEIHLQLQLDFQDGDLRGKSLLQAAVAMSNRDPVKQEEQNQPIKVSKNAIKSIEGKELRIYTKYSKNTSIEMVTPML